MDDPRTPEPASRKGATSLPVLRKPNAHITLKVNGEETEDSSEEITSSLNFEILETGQKVPIRLEGMAYAPRVHLSAAAFDFGSCVMYDHREQLLTLKNQHDLPYHYSFVTPAVPGRTK